MGSEPKKEDTLWLQKQVFGNESLVRRFVEFMPSLEGFPRVVPYQSMKVTVMTTMRIRMKEK